jgi:hypothetical protein
VTLAVALLAARLHRADRAHAALLADHGADPDSFHESATGILTGQVPGDQATPLWLALREVFPDTGLWPIIRGEVLEPQDDEPDFAATIARIPTGSAREILAERCGEFCENNADLVPGVDAKIPFERLAEMADAAVIYSFSGSEADKADWPDAVPDQDLDLQATREPGAEETLDVVGFALAPVNHPYEAVARVGFIGGDAAPAPELLAGVLREWEREYGAVPASITDSIIECAVDRPPQSHAAATSLAVEQWILCEDIVGQGTESVHNLATELLFSRQWFFWWD